MKDKNYPELPESLRETIAITEGLINPALPIIEEQQRLQESLAPLIEQADALKEMTAPIMPASLPVIENPIADTLETVRKSSIITGLGELAMKSAFPDYSFQSPALIAFENISNTLVNNIAAGLKALVDSTAMRVAQEVSSAIGSWLQTIDFTPLTTILDGIQALGFEYDYDDVNEVYLKAMFDARWFPYAGWIADFTMVKDVLDVLDTSRASKNRIKRIDKLIFSYYNKETLDDLKRKWRKSNLPSYMIRMLVQSVQAYNRREYALTVSMLCTLWEGIIQEKVNDDSYRISRRTRENLTKLITENEFDKVFASFSEEFIFYDCRRPEEVKPDVPGRHGIAHCWYDRYPNRKMALNAILFTDFLLELKPLDKTEEKNNG